MCLNPTVDKALHIFHALTTIGYIYGEGSGMNPDSRRMGWSRVSNVCLIL